MIEMRVCDYPIFNFRYPFARIALQKLYEVLGVVWLTAVNHHHFSLACNYQVAHARSGPARLAVERAVV